MVLSLVDLSLISISNGIKDGTIQNLHVLTPKLRQRVLDSVLKRGLINDPKCLALLSSLEFLDGMTSISTSAGNTYDVEFLRRLINSMGVKLPNGETVGAAITKLDLSVYGIMCIFNCCHEDEYREKRSSFPTVCQLIANCPNVTSLALRGVYSEGAIQEEYLRYSDREKAWFPCLFNQTYRTYQTLFNAYKRILENLKELSVSNWTKILGGGPSFINFNRLTTLKLDSCTVNAYVWPRFLRKIPKLEHLHMIEVDYAEWNGNGLDCVLPFSMPNLKSLEIIGVRNPPFECNNAFVSKLMIFPKLRQVHLSLDQESTDERSMARLASMDIDLKLKIQVMVRGYDKAENAAVFDSSSHFKIVSIFHEKMESFELSVSDKWSPLISAALENVIDTCLNLTSFTISLPYRRIPDQNMKRINAVLVRFFGDRERAMQLKDLQLIGIMDEANFDEAVLLAVFENCLKVTQMKIWNCPALRDHHLIDWVSRDGGKLTHLSLTGCHNITSDGIIPILAKSAGGLLKIDVSLDQAGGRKLKAVMKNRCPNAKEVVF